MSAAPPVTPPTTTAVPTNHPTGFAFFFWGEFAERSSYYGMRAILALYMVEKLGVDKSNAGTFMSLFMAACYFFPLIGGWVADNFLGKYWTIVLFSLPYVVAQFLVGIENKYVVFGSLTLLAMGSGVIKPNISTLMGLTYDQQRPGQDQLRTRAFNYFYMAINIGAGLSQFTMPWLRKEYGYHIAFLFPAGLMALALVMFALGKRFYAKERIERKIVGDPRRHTADTKTITGVPVTTTYITPDEAAADKRMKTETLLRIGLLFLTVMFFWAIFDQSASTWIFFADTYMDSTIVGERTDGHTVLLSGDAVKALTGHRVFSLSADAIQAFNAVFIVALVPVSLLLFKALERAGFKVKATQKMLVGFLLTGLSMVIMAFAGTQTGTKTDALKVTTPEGEYVLPKGEVELKGVQPAADGTATVAFGDARLTANGWAYDKERKTASFSGGRLALPGGQSVTFADGGTSLTDSQVFADGKVGVPGAFESNFKFGEYPYRGGKLVVADNNAAAVADGPPANPPKADPDAKVTVTDFEWVPLSGKVSVWWQILAYLIITVAEILISVTGLELAFVAAPPSMKSFVTGCWLAVVFLANLLINASITRLYPTMAPGLYFGLLAAAMGVVMAAFVPIAMRFNRMMAARDEAERQKAVDEGKTEAV